jgi:hypothetical protein
MSNCFGTCFVDGDSTIEPIVDRFSYCGGDLPDSSVNKSPTGSLRFNSNKPEIGQLDPRFILDLADLITKSAKKYGKFNYALGQEFHTPYDSLLRHAMKFWSGEDLDDESKLHHVLHMAANCMILYSSILSGNVQLDTRFKWVKK